jgi:hypothetical protein
MTVELTKMATGIMTLGESASFTSAASEVPGGTSTAGEQLKNPCGCSGENKLKFS